MMIRTLLCVALIAAPSNMIAQDVDLARAKLQIGAELLKAGDIELATKTFAQILDADATNWQARSLLALTYVTTGEFEKVEAELQRLQTVKAPPAAIQTVERQASAARQARRLRDEIANQLQRGKWEEVVARVGSMELSMSRQQLLRAYVAAMRGEFDEAQQLTAGTEFVDFAASVAKRGEEFSIAREEALVALNFLGHRYCSESVAEMRRCSDQAPFTANQQGTWNTIRAGNGKVPAIFAPEKPNLPSSQAYAEVIPQAAAALRARTESALGFISKFVSLAPLHPDAIQLGTVLAFYSGSRDAATLAAERSTNALGVWALKVRRCAFRGGPTIGWRSALNRMNCAVGKDKISSDLLKEEGILILDVRARELRYHALDPKAWLTDIRPVPGASLFKIPFDQLKMIRSRPKLRMVDGTGPWLVHDSLLFDFGAGKTLPMFLDFTFHLTMGEATGLAVKAIEDVVKTLGALTQTVKVDFAPEMAGRSWGDTLATVVGVASVGLGSAGIANASEAGQQILADQGELDAASVRGQSIFWQTVTDLKARDGRSMLETALDDGGVKQDLDALLKLALP